MKYLVRFNKEDNKYVDMVTVNEEYVYKYYKVSKSEQLEEKQGYYIDTYYDEKEDKVKQKYVEIPKTKEELLEEEMIKLKKSITESTIMNKTNETIVEDELKELELTEDELKELENL